MPPAKGFAFEILPGGDHFRPLSPLAATAIPPDRTYHSSQGLAMAFQTGIPCIT